MKYRITKIEMKDENNVVLYLKKADGEAFTAPSIEEALKDPFRLMELSKQIGNACVSSMMEDGYITIGYSEYCELELKVGDVVEVKIKPLG